MGLRYPWWLGCCTRGGWSRMRHLCWPEGMLAASRDNVRYGMRNVRHEICFSFLWDFGCVPLPFLPTAVAGVFARLPATLPIEGAR